MIPVHPAAALLPRMTQEEMVDLAEDIRQNGQRVPVVIHEGMILDGRNRWEACESIGLEPHTQNWTNNGQSPILWVLSMNVKRRHLTPSQKAIIAADALPMLESEARERQRQAAEQTNAIRRGETLRAGRPQASIGKSRDQAAQVTGASGRSVGRAKAVAAADPILAEKVRQGNVTLTAAEHEIRARQKRQDSEARARQVEPVPVHDVRVEVADATSIPLDRETVDLVWTSPPYGLDKPYHGHQDSAQGWVEFMRDFLRDAFRVTVDTGRLAVNVPLDTTNGGYRPTWPLLCQVAIEVGWRYRTAIVWKKGNSTKGNRGLGSQDSADAPHPIAEVEIIGLFSKGSWKRSTPGISDMTPDEWQSWGDGVWELPGESRPWEGHPAPFSERLSDRVIRYLSRVGEVVLDPFCGSGTTLVVARRTKRKPIGFDISPVYVASTTRRLAVNE